MYSYIPWCLSCGKIMQQFAVFLIGWSHCAVLPIGWSHCTAVPIGWSCCAVVPIGWSHCAVFTLQNLLIPVTLMQQCVTVYWEAIRGSWPGRIHTRPGTTYLQNLPGVYEYSGILPVVTSTSDPFLPSKPWETLTLAPRPWHTVYTVYSARTFTGWLTPSSSLG